MSHFILEHIHAPDIFHKQPGLRLGYPFLQPALGKFFRIIREFLKRCDHQTVARDQDREDRKIRKEQYRPYDPFGKPAIIRCITETQKHDAAVTVRDRIKKLITVGIPDHGVFLKRSVRPDQICLFWHRVLRKLAAICIQICRKAASCAQNILRIFYDAVHHNISHSVFVIVVFLDQKKRTPCQGKEKKCDTDQILCDISQ